MTKHKFLTALLSITPLFASVTTSCSRSDNSLAKEIVRQAVDEFINIANVPRPTFHTANIRDYIKSRIKALGYKPCEDVDDPKPTPETGNDPSVNVWFDVPASKGYENCKKVILQAHMDMVVDGVELGKEATTPIRVEYHPENNSLTSKGCKTSLGADNGIGVGLIFALTKNQKFKHGPIRFLITADEEKGMVGAKSLKPEILDSDYFICLDGELDYEGYYRSCQGSCGYNFERTPEDIATGLITQKDMLIEGFAGGHSGQDVNKGRCNATVFIWSLLDAIAGNDLGLISYDYLNSKGEEIAQNRNAIPNFGRVKFVSSKTEAQIKQAFEDTKTKFKAIYNGENWDNVKITSFTETSGVDTKYLKYNGDKNDGIKSIIDLITNKNGDGFVYGPYIVDPQTQRPLLSCNISNLYYDANGQEPTFKVTTYARSVEAKGIDDMRKKLKDEWFNIYPHAAQPSGKQIIDPTYPWEIKENDLIQKLADQAYRSIGIVPTIKDSHGGIENAVFCLKKPSLNLTSLGTKFVSVHTTKETCYLDPLINTVRVLQYILTNVK